MRMVESANGTITVIELDPAKWYWIILTYGCGINPRDIRRRDGLILMKLPDSTLTFVENPNHVEPLPTQTVSDL